MYIWSKWILACHFWRIAWLWSRQELCSRTLRLSIQNFRGWIEHSFPTSSSARCYSVLSCRWNSPPVEMFLPIKLTQAKNCIWPWRSFRFLNTNINCWSKQDWIIVQIAPFPTEMTPLKEISARSSLVKFKYLCWSSIPYIELNVCLHI